MLTRPCTFLNACAQADLGSCGSEALRPGECRGSQKMSFSRKVVSESEQCDHIWTVERTHDLRNRERVDCSHILFLSVSKFSERMCDQIGVIEVPNISTQESVEAVMKFVPQERISEWDV